MFKKYFSLITLFVAVNVFAQTPTSSNVETTTKENTSEDNNSSAYGEDDTLKNKKTSNDRKDKEKPGLGENERFESLGISIPPPR